MAKRAELYIIRAITNMHVGSGDSTYGIIDNQVQRDVVTGFPTINASSLKGALREHFKDKGDKFVNDIFGGETDESGNKITKPGRYVFFPGNLLSIPVRSNKKPYFMATCPLIIKEFLEFLKNLNCESEIENIKETLTQFVDEYCKSKIEDIKNGINGKKVIIFENIDAYIEDEKASYENFDDIGKLEPLFGKNIALMSDELFKSIVNDLPVIARNHLNNGKSDNLWYEEIIPRETRFYTVILKEGPKNQEFEKGLSEIVQIGGNATIGQGYTKIQKFNKKQ